MRDNQFWMVQSITTIVSNKNMYIMLLSVANSYQKGHSLSHWIMEKVKIHCCTAGNMTTVFWVEIK